MITARDIQALAADSFDLHCGYMRLHRTNEPKSKGSSGAGYLRQLEAGDLSLVMFITSNPPPEGAVWGASSRSGELLKDEDYYVLEARDFSGRRWTAARVLPEFTQFSGPGKQLWKAEARIKELQGEDVRANRSGSSLDLRYRGKLDFPFHVRVEEAESIDDRPVREAWRIGAAEFSTLGCNFTVRLDGGYLLVSVASQAGKLPEDIEHRINEALEFLLARRLRWTCTEKREENRLVCRLTGGPRNGLKGRMQLPVEFPPADEVKCTAALDLLQRLLSYIGEHQGSGRPALAVAVRSVIESDHLPLDPHALALAVAVEAVLASEFGDLGQVEGIDEELALVRAAIADLDDLSGQVKSRIDGMLSMMSQPSAKSRLSDLEQRKVVSRPERLAWERIRNKAAHGTFLAEVHQDYINDFGRLMTLFYRLIFTAVGYEGPYRNYGEVGWPWCREED